MGLADRDYNRWTKAEERRFYSGRSGGIPWLTVALIALFVGYVAYGAVVHGTHDGKHYRWCAAMTHFCTGVQH